MNASSWRSRMKTLSRYKIVITLLLMILSFAFFFGGWVAVKGEAVEEIKEYMEYFDDSGLSLDMFAYDLIDDEDEDSEANSEIAEALQYTYNAMKDGSLSMHETAKIVRLIRPVANEFAELFDEEDSRDFITTLNAANAALTGLEAAVIITLIASVLLCFMNKKIGTLLYFIADAVVFVFFIIFVVRVNSEVGADESLHLGLQPVAYISVFLAGASFIIWLNTKTTPDTLLIGRMASGGGRYSGRAYEEVPGGASYGTRAAHSDRRSSAMNPDRPGSSFSGDGGTRSKESGDFSSKSDGSYCPECGTYNPPGSVFCSGCGHMFSADGIGSGTMEESPRSDSTFSGGASPFSKPDAPDAGSATGFDGGYGGGRSSVSDAGYGTGGSAEADAGYGTGSSAAAGTGAGLRSSSGLRTGYGAESASEPDSTGRGEDTSDRNFGESAPKSSGLRVKYRSGSTPGSESSPASGGFFHAPQDDD